MIPTYSENNSVATRTSGMKGTPRQVIQWVLLGGLFENTSWEVHRRRIQWYSAQETHNSRRNARHMDRNVAGSRNAARPCVSKVLSYKQVASKNHWKSVSRLNLSTYITLSVFSLLFRFPPCPLPLFGRRCVCLRSLHSLSHTVFVYSTYLPLLFLFYLRLVFQRFCRPLTLYIQF